MRASCLLLVFAVGLSISDGEPARADDPKGAAPKGPPKEKWEPPEYMAFPELRATKYEDVTKLIDKLKSSYPRPIPANGTALEKVRTARVNEGVAAIIRLQILLETGGYTPQEFPTFLKLMSATFHAESELLSTPEAKIASAEMRVRLMYVFEQFTLARVKIGTDPQRQLNIARFERLEAEADLLILKEKLAKPNRP